jgi:hypothetical protein
MSEKNIWEKPISHGEILKNIWKHLDLATLERHHPFHTPVFGTICDNAPNLRVVVLRRFFRAAVTSVKRRRRKAANRLPVCPAI